ncbi:MAG: histidine triad nucleotide-binding protein [Candidatus Omnitrophica bacterium]|nr:histidine triad nucleotide-binding protein [Candidatus Omnitrophota bacterium]
MDVENCIFCRIVSGAVKAAVVYEDDCTVAFDDINPRAPVHVVIIPKRHIDMVSDLKEKDAGMFGGLAIAANRIARIKGIADSGYRLITNCGKDAGQEVLHIHMHLLGGRKFAWPPG